MALNGVCLKNYAKNASLTAKDLIEVENNQTLSFDRFGLPTPFFPATPISTLGYVNSPIA